MNEQERELYKRRLQERLDDLPIIQAKAADAPLDGRGDYTSGLVGDYRFLGITGYLLHGDVAAFRRELTESARLKRSLFERFEAGERIPGSVVSIHAYRNVLDALAAADFDGARALAEHMRGLNPAEADIHDIEDRHRGHPLTLGMGYAVRDLVLNDDRQQMEASLKQLSDFTEQRKDCRNFAGYADLFYCMLDGEDEEGQAENAVLVIVEGHRKESKGNGIFADDMDRFLCVWGIGVVNLARQRGLAIEPYPPLIPSDLLI